MRFHQFYPITGKPPKEKPTPFVLFCEPRTGSSAIANFFRDLDIHICFEPFRPSKWIGTYINRELIHREMSRQLFYNHGMKHLTSHLSLEHNVDLLNWCFGSQTVIIYLKRKNLTMGLISAWIARQTGVWGLSKDNEYARILYNEIESIPAYPIPELISDLTMMQVHWNIYNELPRPEGVTEYVLYYEDLFFKPLDEKIVTISTLLRELNFPQKLSEVQMITEHFTTSNKQNTPETYRKIENYQELIPYIEQYEGNRQWNLSK